MILKVEEAVLYIINIQNNMLTLVLLNQSYLNSKAMKYLIMLFSLVALLTNCSKEEQIQDLELIGTWKYYYCETTQNGNTNPNTITTDDYLVITESEGCYITSTDTVCHFYTIQPNSDLILWDNDQVDIYQIINDTLTLHYIRPSLETKCYFARQ